MWTILGEWTGIGYLAWTGIGYLAWTGIGYHTKFVETISKYDIYSRTISDENVGDEDPDIGKKNFA